MTTTDDPTPAELAMPDGPIELPREKPPIRLFRLGYALVRGLRRLVGGRELLRLLLDLHFMLKRLAWEEAIRRFPDTLHVDTSGLREETLREAVRSCRSLLDIGCGSGRWCRIAARYVPRVVGLDRDPANLALARRLTSETNVEYREQEVQQLVAGATREAFDVALLVHVLEHVDEPVGLLSALKCVAGTLVVEVPDFDADPLNPVRRRLGCSYWSDPDHVREYTLAELRRELTAAGWRPELVEQRGAAIVCVARLPPD